MNIICLVLGIGIGILAKRIYDTTSKDVKHAIREFEYCDSARKFMNAVRAWFEEHADSFELIKIKQGSMLSEFSHVVNIWYRSKSGETLVFDMDGGWQCNSPVKAVVSPKQDS